MWDFLLELLKTHGLLSVIQVAQAVVIVYLFRESQKKDKAIHTLNDKLLAQSEKRLEDALEEKESYEELARGLDRSIDLLIKVFKKQNGD
jgi:transcriptional regulator GlxA family with amidase domain